MDCQDNKGSWNAWHVLRRTWQELGKPTKTWKDLARWENSGVCSFLVQQEPTGMKMGQGLF
jgi:hypothetical protein